MWNSRLAGETSKEIAPIDDDPKNGITVAKNFNPIHVDQMPPPLASSISLAKPIASRNRKGQRRNIDTSSYTEEEPPSITAAWSLGALPPTIEAKYPKGINKRKREPQIEEPLVVALDHIDLMHSRRAKSLRGSYAKAGLGKVVEHAYYHYF